MLGNFSYCNPTKLYFGENSLFNLSDELKKYGDNVVFVYGTGSIKKNGIYDDIIKILKESNKNITEIISSDEFKNLNLDKQKQMLIACLDANMDYIPLQEIDDENYKFDAQVKQLNNAFYKINN